MLASIFIIVCCTALLVYWLRYSCLLLLQNSTVDKKASAAAGLQFSFGNIRQQLDNVPLSELHRALERDSRVLTYLLDHAAGLNITAWEDRLLVWDYRLMSCWYKVSRTVVPGQARTALSEMAQIMEVLAARMIERAGIQAEV